MSNARRLGLFLCTSLFRFTLLITISLFVLVYMFQKPDHLKAALISSKAYDRFVPAILAANTSTDQQGSVPLTKPQIQAIIQDAFSPRILQTNTEQFIDSSYAWLDGTSPALRFRVDFTASKQQLAEGLSNYAVQHLSSIPLCPKNVVPASLDAFQATCLPRGVSLVGQQAELAKEINDSTDFLPKTVLTQNDLPKNQAGQTLAEQLALAPVGYRLAKILVWISGGITMLFGLGMIFLRPSRRAGWRAVGSAILSDGAFLALSTLVFGRILPNATHSFQSQFSGSGVEAIFGDVVQSLSTSVETLFINIGIQLAVVGALIVGVLHIFKPESPFAGLEKVSGLVSGLGRKQPEDLVLVAAEVPIQSSEQRVVHHHKATHHHKHSAAAKEIA